MVKEKKIAPFFVALKITKSFSFIFTMKNYPPIIFHKTAPL
jgi:hypothetical protein